MAGSKLRTARIFTTSFFTSAFLGAAAALLLAATLSTPTSENIRVTSVEARGGDAGDSYLNLGVLGGCTNIPTVVYEDQPGPNCRSTKVGYEVTLLLPFKFPTSDDEQYQYPWSLTRPYFIVTSGNANDMVLVPIATAFQLLGLIIHILSSCTKGLVIGWIALGCTALGMLLAWASFGVTYRFTDTVKENLRSYNDDVLAVINPLVAHRGNAVWFLAAAAALLTVALLGMLWMQYEKRRALRVPSSATHGSTRKHSTQDEEMEMS